MILVLGEHLVSKMTLAKIQGTDLENLGTR